MRNLSYLVIITILSPLYTNAEETVSVDTPYDQLDDVTVSATRVDKSLYKIPAGIGVVDEFDIQQGKQQLGLDESLIKIPGLFMQNRYNFAQDLRISIRGFGARANFGIRGIKLYQDGIPSTTVDGQGGIDDIDLGSIKRAEVIRGPVSSLYGSSSGGVINLYTEDGPETPFVEAGVTMGEYQHMSEHLKAGGQFNKLNYLFNLSHLDIQGYRSHSRARNTLFNGKLDYDIDNTSDITFILNAFDSPEADDPGGLTGAQVNADRRQVQFNNSILRFNAGEAINQQKTGFTYRKKITANQEILLRNYYLWRAFSARLPFGVPFGNDDGIVEFDRFQLGGGAQYTLSSNLFGHDNRTILGVDIDSQEDDRQRYQNVSGLKGNLTFNQLEKGDSIGIYLQNEFSVTDNLEVTAGVRYDSVQLEVDDKFLGNGDQSAELDFNEVSPMLGLSWSVLPALNIYGNISTSFETPTFTELANPARNGTLGGFANVAAQKAINHEIGIKGIISPGFNYDIALFHIDVEDEIINVANVAGRTFFNNADTTRNGLEAAVSANPFTGVNINVAYTYSDYNFDNFPAAVCTTCSGNDLPGLPEHQFYSEISYEHQSGYFISMDYLYVSSFFVNNTNTVTNRPYGVSNLRTGYINRFGNVEISPFIGINNLFDNEYIGNVRINDNNSRFFEPAPEFNAYGGLSVRYLFD